MKIGTAIRVAGPANHIPLRDAVGPGQGSEPGLATDPSGVAEHRVERDHCRPVLARHDPWCRYACFTGSTTPTATMAASRNSNAGLNEWADQREAGHGAGPDQDRLLLRRALGLRSIADLLGDTEIEMTSPSTTYPIPPPAVNRAKRVGCETNLEAKSRRDVSVGFGPMFE